MNNLKRYYEETLRQSSNEFVVRCIDSIDIEDGNAIDLGCGVGRDVSYLLSKGYHVCAVDSEKLAESYVCNRNSDISNFMSNLCFINKKMEDIELGIETEDVIVAYNSLPFCEKNRFEDVWKKITCSLRKGGYFIGNFWGKEHQFYKMMNGVRKSFFSTEEIYDLFKFEFEILIFEDVPVCIHRTVHGDIYWKECLVFAKKNM